MGNRGGLIERQVGGAIDEHPPMMVEMIEWK